MIVRPSITATAAAVKVLMVFLIFVLLPVPGVTADQSSVADGAAVERGVDLIQRYPTKLTAGDTRPDQARSWDFTENDIFRVTQFRLEVGKDLRVDIGPADLGIGHCADGAVWAVLIPRANGTLTSRGTNQEPISHVWLRFHPKEITRLFPPETVFAGDATNPLAEIGVIANAKMNSSWQAGGRAMIPEPKDMTVDVDTKDGPRRFFVVDTEAQTAQYVDAFENRPVRTAPPLTPDLAKAAFDQLWEAFDQKYAMFVLRPEVDWSSLREQFRPKALACKTTYEFAGVCADMLKNLRDLHVWLTVAGSSVPVFNRPRAANANPEAYRTILGSLHQSGRVAWAVTTNNIGFIAVFGWDGSKTPAECGEALEQMRDTRGLIVEVRLNGGGGEPLAEKFAGRFLEKECVYAYSRFRNGPSHTNLTEKIERKVSPRGPWRYNRPVVLLIGQKCMSSNESFIGMMTGDPEVTTMGDHTCGSSGNPEIVRLPLDMTVSVPQWIDHLPDGTVLDERGFQPQVPFYPAPGAFEGDRDDLLTAALARLSRLPLPDKPIAGPAFERSTADLPDHSKVVNEEAKDASRARVVSVNPTNDAPAVDAVTELHVRFDRPMDPLALKMEWESGGFRDCEFPKYDPEKYEFSIPVHLAPGALQQIVINKPLGIDNQFGEKRKQFPRDGFQSTDHHLAGAFVWRFHTQASPAPLQRERPKVTIISPAMGTSLPVRTFLEIQFDQSMAAPAEACPYLLSDPDMMEELHLVPRIEYDAAKNLFRIPLLLPPNREVAFTLTGFRSAAGVPAAPIRLQYKVSGEELAKADRERMEADAREPQLLKLLETMKQKRLQITSLAERVQDLMLIQKDGLFYELESQCAIFKWQKPDQFYCDITGPMLTCSDCRLGSDAQRCWWHDESVFDTNFSVFPAKEIEKLSMAISDPFGLSHMTSSNAAAQLRVKYDGRVKSGGADYYQMEAWHMGEISKGAPFGSVIQWWIDRRNYRPAQITVFDCGNLVYPVSRIRFLYDTVNQPLPAADFAVPELKGLSPDPSETLGAGYTNRFVRLSDGSDGNMNVEFGETGPKGQSGERFIMDGY